MNPLDVLISRIDNHRRVRWLRRQIANGSFSVDIRKKDQELEDINRRRTIGDLRGRNPDHGDYLQRFQNAALQEMASRSRLVSMRLEVRSKCDRLDKYADTVNNMLRARFAPSLKRLYATAEDRRTAVYHMLEDVYDLIADLENLDKRLLMVIEDIDKLSYHSAHYVETLKIASNRERY